MTMSNSVTSALRIDTLAFAKQLKDAGADERLAEAIVEGLAVADISHLATKDDLNATRQDLKDEIARVRDELKGEIAGVRDELKGDIAGLKGEIAGVRDELKDEIAGVRNELVRFATKVELKAELDRYATKEQLEKTEAVLRSEIAASANKLLYALSAFFGALMLTMIGGFMALLL